MQLLLRSMLLMLSTCAAHTRAHSQEARVKTAAHETVSVPMNKEELRHNNNLATFCSRHQPSLHA